MNRLIVAGLKRLAVLIVPLVILLGCVMAPSPAQPAVSPTQAVVTAIEIPVEVSMADNGEQALNKDDAVEIQVNDRIIVPESGRGVLRFGDRVQAEILRGSEYSLSEVKLEPGDTIFVRLRQVKGHSRVSLSDLANARVRLETDFGSVTTLRAGTEFIVCHDPTLLTCLDVRKGEVEVEGQGKVVVVHAGEATYMLKGREPFSPICARPHEVDAWLEKKLGAGEVQALGELVAGWEQKSCAALAAEGTAVAASAANTPQPLPPAQGMVQIEAGDYTVGSSASDGYHIPPQQTTLAAFWIDVYEVTNAQYQSFLEATGHQPPASWPGREEHPVAGVAWDDAAAYCMWAGKRLPSEAEWEAAGRGPGAYPPLYPWGNDSGADGQVVSLPRTETYEVGAFAFNKSPSGVYDMAGNLWEWVGDPYYPVSEGVKILHGGRYGLIKDMAYRQEVEPNNVRFIPYAGFRCAADQVQGE